MRDKIYKQFSSAISSINGFYEKILISVICECVGKFNLIQLDSFGISDLFFLDISMFIVQCEVWMNILLFPSLNEFKSQSVSGEYEDTVSR